MPAKRTLRIRCSTSVTVGLTRCLRRDAAEGHVQKGRPWGDCERRVAAARLEEDLGGGLVRAAGADELDGVVQVGLASARASRRASAGYPASTSTCSRQDSTFSRSVSGIPTVCAMSCRACSPLPRRTLPRKLAAKVKESSVHARAASSSMRRSRSRRRRSRSSRSASASVAISRSRSRSPASISWTRRSNESSVSSRWRSTASRSVASRALDLLHGRRARPARPARRARRRPRARSARPRGRARGASRRAASSRAVRIVVVELLRGRLARSGSPPRDGAPELLDLAALDVAGAGRDALRSPRPARARSAPGARARAGAAAPRPRGAPPPLGRVLLELGRALARRALLRRPLELLARRGRSRRGARRSRPARRSASSSIRASISAVSWRLPLREPLQLRGEPRLELLDVGGPVGEPLLDVALRRRSARRRASTLASRSRSATSRRRSSAIRRSSSASAESDSARARARASARAPPRAPRPRAATTSSKRALPRSISRVERARPAPACAGARDRVATSAPTATTAATIATTAAAVTPLG